MRRNGRVARLHRLALRIDPQAPPHRNVTLRALAFCLHALTCARQIHRYHALFGRHVFETHGVSHRQQKRDLWHCMWRHNQCARHYYWRKLFLISDRSAWLDNFEHRQLMTLLDHLNACVPAKQLSNKVAFADHCGVHGLRSPSILAVWSPAGKLRGSALADPHCEVFIKPAADFGSVGAQCIGYNAATGHYRLDDRLFNWPDLLNEIGRRHAGETGCLMQRRLRNSSEAALYGDDDICNLRVVTGRSVHGEPEVLAAVMRIPSSFTTQGHDRNVLLSSVDRRTGRMGPGLFRNIMLPAFTHHPDTGARIDGRQVPRWSEILELVQAAHRTCPWMPFVGWDVIDSDQGLVLLEANANWGGDSAQMPGAPPLGQTRFPEIYLEWYEYLKRNVRLTRLGPTDLAPSFEAANQRA